MRENETRGARGDGVSKKKKMWRQFQLADGTRRPQIRRFILLLRVFPTFKATTRLVFSRYVFRIAKERLKSDEIEKKRLTIVVRLASFFLFFFFFFSASTRKIVEVFLFLVPVSFSP